MSLENKDKKIQNAQSSCKQCGICCTKGGAALHGADLDLLLQKKIPRRNLITLRCGEFAWNPVTNCVEATQAEIIKLRGTGGDWTCCYLDSMSNGCMIYEKRPVACRTLKCWKPEASLALIGKDLLSRDTVLQDEDELRKLVEQYEFEHPLPDFTNLSAEMEEQPKNKIAELERLINDDLKFRDAEVQKSETVATEELFLFGRPLFQLLQSFGFEVFQSGERLCLKKSSG